ncbi:hypothetical protein [Marinilactibacillus sp. 15R]|nr:hypothetical protein [Marinilactibacillus sp. 15R]
MKKVIFTAIALTAIGVAVKAKNKADRLETKLLEIEDKVSNLTLKINQ